MASGFGMLAETWRTAVAERTLRLVRRLTALKAAPSATPAQTPTQAADPEKPWAVSSVTELQKPGREQGLMADGSSSSRGDGGGGDGGGGDSGGGGGGGGGGDGREIGSSTITKLLTPTIDWLWFPAAPASYRATRNTIVLCHGLWGFDRIGFQMLPWLQLKYWGEIETTLKKLGANVIISKVPTAGTIFDRAQALHTLLQSRVERGAKLNFVAHSMGGLDCRQLITHIMPNTYHPVSLTTLSTPHRGSSFMDFCRDCLGIGRIESAKPPSGAGSSSLSDPSASFALCEDSAAFQNSSDTLKETIVSKLLKACMIARKIDTPAYNNLTTTFLNKHFNPNTPNMPTTQYYSFGARMPLKDSEQRSPGWSPLHLSHMIISEKEGVNDGLVSVKSATWGKYIGNIARPV